MFASMYTYAAHVQWPGDLPVGAGNRTQILRKNSKSSLQPYLHTLTTQMIGDF